MIHLSDVSKQEDAMSELRPLITAHVFCANQQKQDVYETLYYLSELVAKRDMLRRVASDAWRDMAAKCYNKGIIRNDFQFFFLIINGKAVLKNIISNNTFIVSTTIW